MILAIRFLVLVFCALSCAQRAVAADESTELWLVRLDSSLAMRGAYEQEHVRHIDGLRQLMGNATTLETRYDVCRQIYLAYQSFRADSALVYAERGLGLAREMRSADRETLSKSDIAYALFFTGEFLDSYLYVEGLSGKELPDGMKVGFYKNMHKIWIEFCGISSEKSRQRAYGERAQCYLDSLIAQLPSGSGDWWFFRGEMANTRRNYKEAARCYTKAIADTTLDKHTVAMSYASVAQAYSQMGDSVRSIIDFIKSAIYDNESSTCEVTALYRVAQLIKDYDSERASQYLNQTTSLLLAYNGRFRFMEAGGLMSEIYQERIQSIDREREWLGMTVVLALVVIVLAAGVLLTIRRKNRKLGEARTLLEEKLRLLDNANAKLTESNAVKEGYIGQIFYDNVEFFDKLAHIFNKIGKLLVTRKYDEIGETVSQRELDKERNGMYRNFDKTFVTLYPNFIAKYNSLFDEKNRKYPDKDNILTNEMRIFALIRLGVRESERIARFLGYSVNTVNTYKTRVKNRSVVPNDEFEDKIMEIQ